MPPTPPRAPSVVKTVGEEVDTALGNTTLDPFWVILKPTLMVFLATILCLRIVVRGSGRRWELDRN